MRTLKDKAEGFIQIVIILSIITFTLETLPNLSSITKNILHFIEIFSISIFTIEYIARVIFAKRKSSYIFSFYGLVDIAAILPFYISFGLDLRAIRIVRVMRILRLFKILRYSEVIIKFQKAIILVKAEMVIFSIVTCLLLYIASVGIYYFENPAQPEKFQSIFHCMWWAVATLTTVGYGDIFPITSGGKVFASVVALLGIGIVAVPTGLLASAITEVSNNNSKK